MITTVDFGGILEDLHRIDPVPIRRKGRRSFVDKLMSAEIDGVGDVIFSIAYSTFARSQVLVPVDTGALKSSGELFAWGGGWRIKYYTPYAAYVHEMEHVAHQTPTQSKFLEDAFLDEMRELSSKYGFNRLPDFNVDLEVNVDLGVILTLLPPSSEGFSWRFYLGGD